MVQSETVKEMLESGGVCEKFDFSLTKDIAKEIGDKRVVFTGMGSSLLFPGNNAKNRALKLNIKNRVEAYFSSDLMQYTDFSDTYLFLFSNSGKTKEVVLLLEHAKKHGGTCVAITAVPDSPLANKADRKILMKCGFEKGIAATKSVIEQGLICDSIIFNLAVLQGKKIDFGKLKKDLEDAGKKIEKNIMLDIEPAILEKLSKEKQFYFVGLETGVAAELSLKLCETTGKMAVYYPDTHIFHGLEEGLNKGCAVVIHHPHFSEYADKFKKFQQVTGAMLFGIGSGSDIAGLDIKLNQTFDNYCLLSGGWALVRNLVNALGRDIDHPKRITKVGNPYKETD
ncbi:MAG: SIS domain-containing protein [Candidatus Aenigmarchaeota archaeon]|nr:SIS domain-containing protein [Candidatus Aenigmarchaeota archaeon]